MTAGNALKAKAERQRERTFNAPTPPRMKIEKKTLAELQKRLKTGNRRGVHLNAIPGRSTYKFDFTDLRALAPDIPERFFDLLLTHSSFSFLISWKELQQELSSLTPEQRVQLQRIANSLENIINQNDAIESEKGVNTLGIGYPLLIRRDTTDGQITVAPVLIWHLHASRTNDLNTWRFSRKADDVVYLNEVLINHLQADCGIRIPTLTDDAMNDGVIDAAEVQKLVGALLDKLTTGQASTDKTATPQLQKIQTKQDYEALLGDSSNARIEYGAVLSLFEVQKQNIISEYDELLNSEAEELLTTPLTDSSFQPLSSVSTDPSQQSILNALSQTRNLLIQGPPGTGKSQTLTALLVNALENRKKVLVVCEKQTALNVLEEALKKAGLSDSMILLRDILRDRKTVVDIIRNRYENWSGRQRQQSVTDYAYKNALEKSAAAIATVNGSHLRLAQNVMPGQNWTASVGVLLKTDRLATPASNLEALNDELFTFEEKELLQLSELVHEGEKKHRAAHTGKAVLFKDEALTGTSAYEMEQALKSYQTALRYLVSGVQQDMDAYRQAFIQERTTKLTHLLQQVVAESQQLVAKEQTLRNQIKMLQETYPQLRQKDYDQHAENIRQHISRIEEILAQEPDHRELLNAEATQGFGFKMAAVFSGAKKRIREHQEQIQEATAQIVQALRETEDFLGNNFSGDISGYPATLQQLTHYLLETSQSLPGKAHQELVQAGLLRLPEADMTNESVVRNIRQSVNNRIAETESAPLLNGLEEARNSFLESRRQLSSLLETLYAENSHFDFREVLTENNFAGLAEAAGLLPEIIRPATDTVAARVQEEWQETDLLDSAMPKVTGAAYERAQLSMKAAVQKTGEDNRTQAPVDTTSSTAFLASLQTLTERMQQALDEEQEALETRHAWLRFFREQTPSVQALLEALKETDGSWTEAFRKNYVHRLLRRKFHPDIPTNEEAIYRVREGLAGVQKEQVAVVKSLLYQEQMAAFDRFQEAHPDATVEALYSKRSSAQRKRLSLRNIIRYDLDFFTAQFPIVMTSPDLASNLFAGKNRYFDLVVFDEASQLRLEDTLPALLKGRQAVIAGDEQQMPPSSYFAKVLEGDVEAEDDDSDELKITTGDLLLDTESLLDTGTSLGFHKRFLDFHYRSQHPHLIDFSNHAFYNSRLQPLPNRHDYVPILFTAVNGTFSEYENEKEAEEVLRILEQEIERRPDGTYPSVGIATFNIHQRNLIIRKIQQRRNQENGHVFQSKLAALENNGLFVKNLENIQGDERDIIILSVTYGPNKDGRFAQRFASLTQEKGYRLLNVIVTRARQKMYVLSSVPEEVFSGYRQYLQIEGVRRKAAFYSYLAYAQAVSTGNETRRKQILHDLKEASGAGQYATGAEIGLAESPFEEEVYEYLQPELGRDYLQLQKPFAGFRIDLVYQSPLKGVPPVAIECDGAKYHSSEEAYLYDLHRQRILEDHGFVFHRIWSANWWRNPKRETEKLVAFVRKLEAETAIPETEEA